MRLVRLELSCLLKEGGVLGGDLDKLKTSLSRWGSTYYAYLELSKWTG